MACLVLGPRASLSGYRARRVCFGADILFPGFYATTLSSAVFREIPLRQVVSAING